MSDDAAPALDLITVGGITWDTIVTSSDARLITIDGETLLAFRHGSKVHLDQATFAVGGGAANVAVVARRLGLRTAVWGRVGRDATGRSALDQLCAEDVEVSAVRRDASEGTGMSLVLAGPDGDRTILVHAGATARIDARDFPVDALGRTRWLYVSSLRGPAGDLFDDLAEQAADGAVRLALNPGATQVERGTRGLHTALSRCDLLLVNDDEARTLLGARTNVPPTDLVRRLRERTAGLVVVTCGARGSVGCTADGAVVSTPAVPGPIVCTVGAGDAFGGTLVASLATGSTLGRAMRLAAVNATAVVGRYGAHDGALTRAALEARLDRCEPAPGQDPAATTPST